MQILNTEIMAHPMNWLTIFMMVFLFMVLAGLLTGHYQMVKNSDPSTLQ